MKNYLVITLGTREIQLPVNKIEENNFEIIEEKGEKFSKYFIQKRDESSVKIEVRQPSKEFPDFYTISPRTTGKIIDDNYTLFRPIIDFPIVRPAIEYLKHKKVTLDVIMLIYTDQEEAFKNGKVKIQNQENDSIYYANIISKLIKEDIFFANTEIDQFAIIDNVTDLGFQYDDFKRINDALLYPDEVKQVFLYPQGGIDQINQALVLRLVETFKGKVKQLQKSEGADFKEIDFASKFLGSLNKQKIIKHLQDYDFGLIDKELTEGLMKGNVVFLECQRAYNELNLNSMGTSSEKIVTLYLSAKIALHKKDYSSFIWKMFTIIENIFKVECELAIGDTTKYYNSKADKSKMVNTEWHKFLKQCLPNFSKELSLKLYQFLESSQVDGKPLNINNPNRFLFQFMYKFLRDNEVVSVTQEKVSILDKINGILSNLSYHRNKIAHDLYPVSYDKLINWLGSEKTLKKLIRNCDEYFEVKGMGKYDELKNELIQQL